MHPYHRYNLIGLQYPDFRRNQLRLILLEASIMLIRKRVYRIIKTICRIKKLKGINLKQLKKKATI